MFIRCSGILCLLFFFFLLYTKYCAHIGCRVENNGYALKNVFFLSFFFFYWFDSYDVFTLCFVYEIKLPDVLFFCLFVCLLVFTSMLVDLYCFLFLFKTAIRT